MTFSLLHFLASHPRNADTLKKALKQNTDARRLLGCFGITPTHLEYIDEGMIARRSAAVSVRSGTIRLTAPASCADRLAEAEKTIKALEARLAQTAPKPEQTPPEEVIVLGPWRNENGVMRREKLAEPWKGYAFMHAYPATPKGAWSCIRPERAHEVDGVYHDIGGMPVADDWARDRYALIDAEPGSLKGALAPWYETDRMWYRGSVIGFVQVYKHGYGWQIYKSGDKTCSPLAHGPQTGEEGKRYALAAAHALGLTGGGE